FAERLLADYLRDPQSVSDSWRRYFAALGIGNNGSGQAAKPRFESSTLFDPPSARLARQSWREARQQFSAARLQDRLAQLVRAYRVRGHLAAQIDPLGLPREVPPELDPAWYGFH